MHAYTYIDTQMPILVIQIPKSHFSEHETIVHHTHLKISDKSQEEENKTKGYYPFADCTHNMIHIILMRKI